MTQRATKPTAADLPQGYQFGHAECDLRPLDMPDSEPVTSAYLTRQRKLQRFTRGYRCFHPECGHLRCERLTP